MVTATSFFLNLFAIVVPSSVFGGGVFEISGNRNSRWKESRSLVMSMLLRWSWLSSRDFVNHSTDRWKSSMRVYVCVKIDTTFAICLAYFPAIFGFGCGRKGDGKVCFDGCWVLTYKKPNTVSNIFILDQNRSFYYFPSCYLPILIWKCKIKVAKREQKNSIKMK